MSDLTMDPKIETRPEASAVAWSWCDRAAKATDSLAREAQSLRIRGVVGGAVGLAFAALLSFVGHKVRTAEVVAGIAIVLALLAVAAPLTGFKKVNHVLEVFARGVATGVTWILMTILFYVVFLPIGLVLRAGHKLGITKGADRRLRLCMLAADPRDPHH